MARSKKELNEKYQSPFASRLRELMDTSKMTQDTLAQKIGKTRQTVSQYVNGDSEPGYSTLVKIAEIFNTTTDYLLGVTNAKSISTDERTIVDKTGIKESNLSKIFVAKEHGLNNMVEYINDLISIAFTTIGDYDKLCTTLEIPNQCQLKEKNINDMSFEELVILAERGQKYGYVSLSGEEAFHYFLLQLSKKIETEIEKKYIPIAKWGKENG